MIIEKRSENNKFQISYPTFLSVLVTFGVSKPLSRSISLAVYCFQFLADQISCRSYVGSVYRMKSLAVSGFLQSQKKFGLCACSQQKCCTILYRFIHLIPKWPPFKYSFDFLQISPCCLVLKLEIQKNIFPVYIVNFCTLSSENLSFWSSKTQAHLAS